MACNTLFINQFGTRDVPVSGNGASIANAANTSFSFTPTTANYPRWHLTFAGNIASNVTAGGSLAGWFLGNVAAANANETGNTSNAPARGWDFQFFPALTLGANGPQALQTVCDAPILPNAGVVLCVLQNVNCGNTVNINWTLTVQPMTDAGNTT